MADPSSYRPAPGQIPLDPGVYRFRDAGGRVIYVGKAKSLRPRLSSYFQDIAALHPRTARMVRTGASVEWTVVANEVEALQLEYSWIKEYDPRFNVRYRDDKSYPFLAVTLGDTFPRAQVMRGTKRKGTRYFGPYSHAWAIRETLDLLLRVFPVRTCSSGVFARAQQSGRPCLLGYIDKCSAPCVGRVTEQAHRDIALDFCDFMAGNTTRFVRRTEAAMRAAAAELEFERAATLRDDLQALSKALEKNAVVLGDATDADVFALVDDELEAAVQVFHVRGGRVRGQRGWVVERGHEDVAGLVEHLLQQVYGDQPPESIPKEVLVPVLPSDPEGMTAWLTSHRGSAVALRVPQRGDKRALMETVRKNAEQSLARHKLTRAGDLTARSLALSELHTALGLAEAPLRIECFDVSHVQGTQMVASMVVFEDGLARPTEYRRFVIRSGVPAADDLVATGAIEETPGSVVDDTAAMREVLTRRFRRLLQATLVGEGESGEGAPVEGTPASPIDPATGKARKFAYPPNLVVVDGGLPQVNAAAAVLADLGVTGIHVVGLAKRLEEVWLPGDPYPVVLPRSSEGLYLLQRVRDEAHRFAITFHRKRRSAAMTASVLDGIPGLGATRQAALLAHFGSVRKLRAATRDQVQQVPGIGPRLADTILAALQADPGSSGVPAAVNVTTGEVLD
ncbi:MAG: excinuclease ABC subunit UvrC [Actinomycetales bacterium]|nr:excinuclease ABC subunit UvrC [Actinomycetales bacterium]